MEWKKKCDAALFKLRAINVLLYSVSIGLTLLSLFAVLFVIVQSRDPRSLTALAVALIYLAFKVSGFYRQWWIEKLALLKQYEFEAMQVQCSSQMHNFEVSRVAGILREVSPESAFAVLQSPIIQQENSFTVSFSPAAVCRITAQQDFHQYSAAFTSLLNRQELLFVVAHETGHVRCGAESLRLMARWLHLVLMRSIFALYLFNLAIIYASPSVLYGFVLVVLWTIFLLVGLGLRGIAAHREEFIADLYAARELKLRGGDPLVAFVGIQLSVYFFSMFCLPIPSNAVPRSSSHPSMRLRQKMLEQVFG